MNSETPELCNIHVTKHDNLMLGTIAIEAIKEVLGCGTYLAATMVSKGWMIYGGLPKTDAENRLRDLLTAWTTICTKFNRKPSEIPPFYLVFQDEV